jgi:signal transduction histidine kinase
MNSKSIRWRLPFSYAAIALLAALALGSVMLLVLHGYYVRLERDYLTGNALALQPMVEDALRADVPPNYLQDTIDGLAFLSQTRIQVLDEQGNTIVDSGIPDPDQVISVSGGIPDAVIFSMPVSAQAESGDTPIPAEPAQGIVTMVTSGAPVPPEANITYLTVGASPFGVSFIPYQSVSVASSTRRSTEKASLTLSDSLGTLEISNGPAYGREIVRSVSLAWAGAGAIAILLAALAGWFASRQVTLPVLALIGATRRMEQGTLSTRVELPGRRQTREFQELAGSFNGMAQRVEDTVSTLRDFVADAAHELHTPLTALHTNLELAADESDPDRRSQYLESAQEQNQRLEALVSGLLDLSRIEAAGKTTDPLPLVITRVVQAVGGQFAGRAESAGRVFNLELSTEPLLVEMGEAQLRRVLTNLLENALKFTSPGDRITLRLAQQEGQASLSVSDGGIGIPPEDLPHLFERFHRGRNASRYPGSGLGLAIVRALVEAQAGSVRAESSMGEGTRIIVTLPLAGSKDAG